jgi:hypothetical protein
MWLTENWVVDGSKNKLQKHLITPIIMRYLKKNMGQSLLNLHQGLIFLYGFFPGLEKYFTIYEVFHAKL